MTKLLRFVNIFEQLCKGATEQRFPPELINTLFKLLKMQHPENKNSNLTLNWLIESVKSGQKPTGYIEAGIHDHGFAEGYPNLQWLIDNIPLEQLDQRERVIHETFGEGIVDSVSGDNVVVYFENENTPRTIKKEFLTFLPGQQTVSNDELQQKITTIEKTIEQIITDNGLVFTVQTLLTKTGFKFTAYTLYSPQNADDFSKFEAFAKSMMFGEYSDNLVTDMRKLREHQKTIPPINGLIAMFLLGIKYGYPLLDIINFVSKKAEMI